MLAASPLRAPSISFHAVRSAGNRELSRDSGRHIVPAKMMVTYLLTAALAALMVVQSALGLLFQEQYRGMDQSDVVRR